MAVVALIANASAAATTKATYAIDYVVTISPQHPGVAYVRWELSGIDEVRELRLTFPVDQLEELRATGRLEPIPGGVRWTPGGPYAHLSYRVKINHVRGQHQRYDSYAGPDWIVTRARHLFPRIAIDYHPRTELAPKSRARLIFRLPAGWRSATALEPIGPTVYRLSQPDMTLDRPRGWFALGKFPLEHEEIADIMLQVACLPGSALVPKDLFRFLDATLPRLERLLLAPAQTILLVSAPDPMWHGGISGEFSLYMHGKRPLRTPDKTSPYLHELFHVLQPYKPAADADWIEEGLAEYYSLELQRRAGLIDAAAFARALGYFERFGKWHVDLTRQHDNAATNNSAPLVMYALDQRIQRASAGKLRLDDLVSRLAKNGGTVDTASFLHELNALTGRRFTKFFERHVFGGAPPRLDSAQ